MTKKQEKKMVNYISDYFCDVILSYCNIVGYKVSVHYDPVENKEKTFGIKVNYPYRRIDLYIRDGGREMYEDKEWDNLRLVLFHEAFHILHWKFRDYANSRFVEAATMVEMEEDLAEQFSFIVNKAFEK